MRKLLITTAIVTLFAGSAFAGELDHAALSAAKTKCGADPVVWVNTPTHVYHIAGYRYFGTTKSGSFMCEKDASAAGDKLAGNEREAGPKNASK